VSVDIVVMAAGEGTRLRPLTERWAKPVLPIDGRAVLATLLLEIAGAPIERVWLVTGHLAEQVEEVAAGDAFGLDVRLVRQPHAHGSADAVRRALAAGATPPLLVSAADTVYAHGAVGDFARAFEASGAAGAVAVRRQAGRPAATRIQVEDGMIRRMSDPDAPGDLTAAPLTAFAEAIAREVPSVCEPPFRPPYELAVAFQRAIDAGEPVIAFETGATRDLTDPLDLVRENFPYLRGLSAACRSEVDGE
jgi:UDP-N-acetylglucosamine diphosphorylase / glucose-1-phosphate thymidylyltransferase / UDP-N-acetylgalactosamine diphosphorylase / glucosamine-1-phosphate N-acetyltransferase / galactosamine-1-phosphate N-acetyltransferase